jgi:hypothetical protein
MRTRSLIFFVLVSFLLSAQNDSLPKFKQCLELGYGNKFLKVPMFNGQLNDLSNLRLGTPISYISISTTGYIVINRQGEFPGQWHYSHIIPQKIMVNDSISAKITGFNFGVHLWGFDLFRRSKYVGLFVDFGFNTGRLRLTGDPYVNQKNPYFSPKLTVIPRVYISNFCFQITAEYDHDISSKNWRKTNFSNSPKINLLKASSSGLTVLASVGIFLPDPKPSRYSDDDSPDE